MPASHGVRLGLRSLLLAVTAAHRWTHRGITVTVAVTVTVASRASVTVP